MLAVNAPDDERNPPRTGLLTEALRHVKQAVASDIFRAGSNGTNSVRRRLDEVGLAGSIQCVRADPREAKACLHSRQPKRRFVDGRE